MVQKSRRSVARLCSLLKASQSWLPGVGGAALLPGSSGKESASVYRSLAELCSLQLWGWSLVSLTGGSLHLQANSHKSNLLVLWNADFPSHDSWRKIPPCKDSHSLDSMQLINRGYSSQLKVKWLVTLITSAKSILPCNVTYTWDNTRGKVMGPKLCLPWLVKQFCPMKSSGPDASLHLSPPLGRGPRPPWSRRWHGVHSDQVLRKVPSSCLVTRLPSSHWSSFVTLWHPLPAAREAGLGSFILAGTVPDKNSFTMKEKKNG